MATDINIDYVANLARLALSDEERQKYSEQLSEIIDYFQKLSELDVDNVEPMAHAIPVYNVWAEDKAESPLNVEKALEHAPEQRLNQVLVPKVIDDA